MSDRWKFPGNVLRALCLLIAASFVLATCGHAQSVRLEFQDGSALERDIKPGWTHWTEPLGSHLWTDGDRSCLRVTAGVIDAGPVGTVFFSRLIVDTGIDAPVIVPRAGWSVEGSRIIIGTGRECIPPRGSLRVRWARPGLSVAPPPPSEWVFQLGDLPIPLPESVVDRERWRIPRLLDALKTGAADWSGARLATPALGLWHPYGEVNAGEGGANGIEPLSGWERSWELAVLCHDLTMERTPIDALRASDGEPVRHTEIDAKNYTLARGWMKPGQLPIYCEPLNPENQYDERRKPKRWNAGEADYFSKIHGIDRYSEYLPPDGMHQIRSTRFADASAQLWGDACAAFDLRALAGDVALAKKKAPRVRRGQGSGWFGRRDPAWSVWTMLAADDRDSLALALASCMSQVQMPNGMMMRLSSDYGPNGNGHGLIPNGWVSGDNGISKPIGLLHDLAQRFEHDYTLHALARAGEWDAVERGAAIYLPRKGSPSIQAQLGYAPKYLAVADQHGAPHRQIVSWTVGLPDYFGHLVPGLMACRAIQDGEDPTKWIKAAIEIPTPSGKRATNAAELRHLLATDPIWCGGAIALLSALERVQ